jgi:hypothetical protein
MSKVSKQNWIGSSIKIIGYTHSVGRASMYSPDAADEYEYRERAFKVCLVAGYINDPSQGPPT